MTSREAHVAAVARGDGDAKAGAGATVYARVSCAQSAPVGPWVLSAFLIPLLLFAPRAVFPRRVAAGAELRDRLAQLFILVRGP